MPLATRLRFFGVWSLKAGLDLNATVPDMGRCEDAKLTPDILDSDFGTPTYTFQAYTGGCYFFNKTTEIWESGGLTTYNSTKLVTGCGTNHCTSFGSAFFPQTNLIDFNFVFAHASFEDNMTIYIFVIITLIFYLAGLIYAFIKDRRDVRALPVPILADNHPDDKYLYEILVETGPLANHATTSNISFILFGDEEDTGARQVESKRSQENVESVNQRAIRDFNATTSYAGTTLLPSLT